MKDFLIYLLIILNLIFIDAKANEIIDENVEQAGLNFWKALANADVEAMESFYASQVTLIGGSELLNEEWGINFNKDRYTNLQLNKMLLLKGYQKMIKTIKSDKWRKFFSNIDTNKIIFQLAKNDRESFSHLEKNDVIMIVPTSVRDNRLFFFFSEVEDDIWLITSEATDY